MDADNGDTTDTLGYFAMLPNEVIEHIIVQLSRASDACRLLMTCRAFAVMAGDQRIWKLFYATLGAVDTGAVPEAWGKDWCWLCRARTTPANGTNSIKTVCGAKTYYDGCCAYHGKLLDGLPHGYGIAIFVADGLAIQGRRGPCVSNVFACMPLRGCSFEGKWARGRFVDGRCVFQNHDSVFRGTFRDAMVTASESCHDGVLTYANGECYVGQMRGGMMCGRGAYTFASGVRYEGEYASDTRNGQGSMFYSDGARYEGQWKDGSRDGYGVYQWADGKRYEGNYKGDQKHGWGTLSCPDGRRYEGEWKKGMKDGRGLYRLPSEYTYDGAWQRDKRHGHGTCQFSDGRHFDGIWRDDILVEGHTQVIPTIPISDAAT